MDRSQHLRLLVDQARRKDLLTATNCLGNGRRTITQRLGHRCRHARFEAPSTSAPSVLNAALLGGHDLLPLTHGSAYERHQPPGDCQFGMRFYAFEGGDESRRLTLHLFEPPGEIIRGVMANEQSRQQSVREQASVIQLLRRGDCFLDERVGSRELPRLHERLAQARQEGGSVRRTFWQQRHSPPEQVRGGAHVAAFESPGARRSKVHCAARAELTSVIVEWGELSQVPVRLLQVIPVNLVVSHRAFAVAIGALLPVGKPLVQGGTTSMANSMCTGPITYRGSTATQTDIANFRTALQGRNFEEAFIPAVAPGTIELQRANHFYKTEEDYLYALADSMKVEYRMIVDAGFILQIDDPRMVTEYDSMDPPPSPEEYRRFATVRIEALNHALAGLPEDRVRYHMCWGSWHGPHTTDAPLHEIAPVILKIKAGAFSLEALAPALIGARLQRSMASADSAPNRRPAEAAR